MVSQVEPQAVKEMLSDGQEIAFLDVREHGQFGDGHPFFANSVPYSKFEVRLVEVVPVQVAYQNSAINIIKGVQAGDVLVSDGQSRLKAGAQVEVLKEPPQVIHTANAQVQP